MKGKKILIGITASIAAYKIPQLVRSLQQEGAEVRVMMTPSAKAFVSPLVLSTLSKHDVYYELLEQDTWSNHVMLGRWADAILIAPASCNTISKMAHGLCDNFLLATYMSATCPVIIAPAMDEDMYHHPATQKNIEQLKQFGHQIIDAQHGELASGLVGMGRMAELQYIVDFLSTFFKKKNDLAGKHVLITAGPTYENLDPVRFIGNHSTGKMGIAIAEAAASRGAQVQLILGPTSLRATHNNITTTHVTSAQDMLTASLLHFSSSHIAIMSAAVADYTPINVAQEKMKKNDGELSISLSKTTDILATLGAQKKQQLLVGFALESTNEEAYAKSKLEKKNADFIVLNSIRDAGAGFGHDTNKITIFSKDGSSKAFELKNKQAVATDILDTIIPHLHAN